MGGSDTGLPRKSSDAPRGRSPTKGAGTLEIPNREASPRLSGMDLRSPRLSDAVPLSPLRSPRASGTVDSRDSLKKEKSRSRVARSLSQGNLPSSPQRSHSLDNQPKEKERKTGGHAARQRYFREVIVEGYIPKLKDKPLKLKKKQNVDEGNEPGNSGPHSPKKSQKKKKKKRGALTWLQEYLRGWARKRARYYLKKRSKSMPGRLERRKSAPDMRKNDGMDPDEYLFNVGRIAGQGMKKAKVTLLGDAEGMAKNQAKRNAEEKLAGNINQVKDEVNRGKAQRALLGEEMDRLKTRQANKKAMVDFLGTDPETLKKAQEKQKAHAFLLGSGVGSLIKEQETTAQATSKAHDVFLGRDFRAETMNPDEVAYVTMLGEGAFYLPMDDQATMEQRKSMLMIKTKIAKYKQAMTDYKEEMIRKREEELEDLYLEEMARDELNMSSDDSDEELSNPSDGELERRAFRGLVGKGAMTSLRQYKRDPLTEYKILCGYGDLDEQYAKKKKLAALLMNKRTQKSRSQNLWSLVRKTGKSENAPMLSVLKDTISGVRSQSMLYKSRTRQVHNPTIGLVYTVFDYISQRSRRGNRSYLSSVYIPETIVYCDGNPKVWFYTNKNGEIRRRKFQEMRPAVIEKTLMQNDSIPAGVTGAGKRKPQKIGKQHVMARSIFSYSQVTELEHKITGKKRALEDVHSVTSQEFLNPDMLHEFVRERKDKNGLLQQFVYSKGGFSFVIRVSMFLSKYGNPKVHVERRTNNQHLDNLSCSMYDKGITYDGPEALSTAVDVQSDALINKLTKMGVDIVKHIEDCTPVELSIKFVELNFTIDENEKIWFLWCSKIESDDPTSDQEIFVSAYETGMFDVKVQNTQNRGRQPVYYIPKNDDQRNQLLADSQCFQCPGCREVHDQKHKCMVTYKDIMTDYMWQRYDHKEEIEEIVEPSHSVTITNRFHNKQSPTRSKTESTPVWKKPPPKLVNQFKVGEVKKSPLDDPPVLPPVIQYFDYAEKLGQFTGRDPPERNVFTMFFDKEWAKKQVGFCHGCYLAITVSVQESLALFGRRSCSGSKDGVPYLAPKPEDDPPPTIDRAKFDPMHPERYVPSIPDHLLEELRLARKRRRRRRRRKARGSPERFRMHSCPPFLGGHTVPGRDDEEFERMSPLDFNNPEMFEEESDDDGDVEFMKDGEEEEFIMRRESDYKKEDTEGNGENPLEVLAKEQDSTSGSTSHEKPTSPDSDTQGAKSDSSQSSRREHGVTEPRIPTVELIKISEETARAEQFETAEEKMILGSSWDKNQSPRAATAPEKARRIKFPSVTSNGQGSQSDIDEDSLIRFRPKGDVTPSILKYHPHPPHASAKKKSFDWRAERKNLKSAITPDPFFARPPPPPRHILRKGQDTGNDVRKLMRTQLRRQGIKWFVDRDKLRKRIVDDKATAVKL